MHKKLLLSLILVSIVSAAFAQDGILGNGFGTNDWLTIDNMSASAGGSQIIVLNPNAIGDRYFQTTDNGQYQIPAAGCGTGDVAIADKTPYTALSTNCGSGAWFINCPNTTDNYVFKTPAADGNRFIVFRVQGAVETVVAVAQSLATIYPAQDQTITATVSGTGALASGQGVYLRYTTDGFATSTVVEMTYTGSGQDYTADIPASANTAGTNISYYVFTSGDGQTISAADADWYTINLNNNGGPNYSYTVETDWTTRTGGDGSWDDPNMWDALQVPPAGVPVRIQDDLVLDMDANVSNIVIEGGVNFTAGDGTPRTLSITNGGNLENNGSYTSNLETIQFLGNGSIIGTLSLYNVETSGGLDAGGNATVNNRLTILTGGFITGNAFNYAVGSTLSFNTGGTYVLNFGSLAWNGTVTPHHLEILAGTQLRLENDFLRNLNGNLTIDGAGAQLLWTHDNFVNGDLNIGGNLSILNGGDFTISDGDGGNSLLYGASVGGDFTVDATSTFLMNNDIGDDLTIAGDLTNNGVFNSNNRLVVFNGGSLQNLSGTFSGSSVFHYLEVNNAAGINLSSDLHIEDELRMTIGLIFTNSSNLVLEQNAVIIGTNNSSSMIVPTGTGFVVKEFASLGSFTFPVGDNTGVAEYSPATITLNAGTLGANAAIQVQLRDEKHPGNPSTTDFLTRHWTVEQNDITGIDYDLNLTYVDADITGTEANILELKSNDGGASWLQLGTVDAVTNRISLPAQSSFSIFTGGDPVALPVELLSFRGEGIDGKVHLFWSTATEINNDYFEIERSSVATEWELLHRENAVGNSNTTTHYSTIDPNPFNGINYYRLSQTDFDGTKEYVGEVIAIEMSRLGYESYSFQNGVLNLYFDAETSTDIDIRLYDALGITLFSKENLQIESGRLELAIPNIENHQQVFYLQIIGGLGLGKTLKLVNN
jgi:hypothetical protein